MDSSYLYPPSVIVVSAEQIHHQEPSDSSHCFSPLSSAPGSPTADRYLDLSHADREEEERQELDGRHPIMMRHQHQQLKQQQRQRLLRREGGEDDRHGAIPNRDCDFVHMMDGGDVEVSMWKRTALPVLMVDDDDEDCPADEFGQVVRERASLGGSGGGSDGTGRSSGSSMDDYCESAAPFDEKVNAVGDSDSDSESPHDEKKMDDIKIKIKTKATAGTIYSNNSVNNSKSNSNSNVNNNNHWEQLEYLRDQQEELQREHQQLLREHEAKIRDQKAKVEAYKRNNSRTRSAKVINDDDSVVARARSSVRQLKLEQNIWASRKGNKPDVVQDKPESVLETAMDLVRRSKSRKAQHTDAPKAANSPKPAPSSSSPAAATATTTIPAFAQTTPTRHPPIVSPPDIDKRPVMWKEAALGEPTVVSPESDLDEIVAMRRAASNLPSLAPERLFADRSCLGSSYDDDESDAILRARGSTDDEHEAYYEEEEGEKDEKGDLVIDPRPRPVPDTASRSLLRTASSMDESFHPAPQRNAIRATLSADESDIQRTKALLQAAHSIGDDESDIPDDEKQEDTKRVGGQLVTANSIVDDTQEEDSYPRFFRGMDHRSLLQSVSQKLAVHEDAAPHCGVAAAASSFFGKALTTTNTAPEGRDLPSSFFGKALVTPLSPGNAKKMVDAEYFNTAISDAIDTAASKAVALETYLLGPLPQPAPKPAGVKADTPVSSPTKHAGIKASAAMPVASPTKFTRAKANATPVTSPLRKEETQARGFHEVDSVTIGSNEIVFHTSFDNDDGADESIEIDERFGYSFEEQDDSKPKKDDSTTEEADSDDEDIYVREVEEKAMEAVSSEGDHGDDEEAIPLVKEDEKTFMEISHAVERDEPTDEYEENEDASEQHRLEGLAAAVDCEDGDLNDLDSVLIGSDDYDVNIEPSEAKDLQAAPSLSPAPVVLEQKVPKPSESPKPKPAKAPKRVLTPKKDMQSSDNSAGWLQEELYRRSIIKAEINKAILARNGEDKQATESESNFAMELAHALETISPRRDCDSSPPSSTKPEKIAAIIANEANAAWTALPRDLVFQSASIDNVAPRQLEFDPAELDTERTSNRKFHRNRSLDPPTKPKSDRRRRVSAPLLPALSDEEEEVVEDSDDDQFNLQEILSTMDQFVSTTRTALHAPPDASHTASDLTFRPIVEPLPESSVRPGPQIVKPATSRVSSSGSVSSRNNNSVSRRGGGAESVSSRANNNSVSRRGGGADSVCGSVFSELQTGEMPVLVEPLDSVLGILKGDITLSLLNDNTGRLESSGPASWADRVRGAIWRCRRMRQELHGLESNAPGNPAKGRSSLPVDLDQACVAGGFRSVASTQEAALNHLKHDEIDDSLELLEDVMFAYHSFFETKSQANSSRYIGVALHNLGILNLLNGKYNEALSFFARASDNRKAGLGCGHPDHVTSLVKVAICLYALNDFGEAHSKLEEALCYAKQSSASLSDAIQVSEILNNLGCLSYMCGEPMEAKDYFKESLDIQFAAMSESLYDNPPFAAHSISLNISISRANLGFVKLVTNELPVAITALEAALVEQQLLLKGAHNTIIATMDHLAVANMLNGNQGRASQMFSRILRLQQSEFGPDDPRCSVTSEKIRMLSQGTASFERAAEELRMVVPVKRTNEEWKSSRSIEPSRKLHRSSSKSGRKKGLFGKKKKQSAAT